MTMSDVSSFVAQNSAWLIGIGAVLLLALIGFIADKTHFVRLDKPSEEAPHKEPAPVVIENRPLKEILNKQTEVIPSIGDIEKQSASEDHIPSIDDTNKTNVVPTIGAMEVSPVEIINFDKIKNSQEETNTFKPVIEDDTTPKDDTNNIPKELFAPLGDTLKEPPTTTDDDIWKF